MRRSVLTVALVVAATAFLGSGTATAAPATQVVINATVDFETGVGSFVAVGGGVCRSGATSDVSVVRPLGGIITFDVHKTFTCADGSGTFTLRIFAGVHPCARFNSGVWRVAAGTGAYETLSGSGQLVGSYLPADSCTATSVDDHLTGKMQLG
ncbi:MAG: hypothetical protein H0V10_08545 [Geodermatophilaceae bacterium]|nr:hypothetical protein [Geodermatophilaceae bacterium]